MNQPSMQPDNYPVHVEITSPDGYDRIQLLLRLLVSVSVGLVHQSLGGILCALYLVLPTVAAILISQRSPRGYLERDAGWLSGVLEWLVALYAYMLCATDRFPLESQTRALKLHITPRGEPSLTNALVRLLSSLPQALFLAVVGLLSAFVSLLLTVVILFGLRAPAGLVAFQRDYVAGLARFLAYHASLVDVYPPFALAKTASAPNQDGLQGA